MEGGTNYRTVEIEGSKPPDEYNWMERRAEILNRIERLGHPRAVNQSQLADRYGVSGAQISKDMERLREYISSDLDASHADAITQTVYQKSIQELMKNGEHYKAVKAVESWNDWLMDRGKVEQEPDQHEVEGRGVVFNLDE
jgi:hypothetical protein